MVVKAPAKREGSKNCNMVRFAVPEVIIYAPESDDDEPSSFYAPNEYVWNLSWRRACEGGLGCGKPAEKKWRNALNAFLQVLVALPEINEELPVASQDSKIVNFLNMVRTLCCDMESGTVADEQLMQLRWWEEACGVNKDGYYTEELSATSSSTQSTETVLRGLSEDFERVVRPLMDQVLLRTRFGKRFETELVEVGKNEGQTATNGLDDNVKIPGEKRPHSPPPPSSSSSSSSTN
ncbi:hypothetical protein HK104_004252, partial [Borealophlyctis nickersoniae]